MWQYKHSDELYHWKYIDKVKTKDGKWRYIYDTDKLKGDMSNATNVISDKLSEYSPEYSRKMDKAVYDTNEKALQLEKQMKIAKIQKNTGDSDFMREMKITSVVISNKAKQAGNDILRRLNMVGDGKLDNKVRDIAKKGKDFFASFFK